MIKVGDTIPAVTLTEFVEVEGNGCSIGPNPVDVAKVTAGKTIALFALPGAFTPTCMATHVPDFIAKAEAIKAAGCDEILALAVNDPFVVTAFAEKLGGKGLVNYVADGNGELTKALGLELDLSVAQLGTNRTKRCSMIVKEG